MLGSFLIDGRIIPNFYIYLRQHFIEFYDSKFQNGWPSLTDTFFTPGKTLTRQKSPKVMKGVIFETYLWRHNQSVKHYRLVYDFLGVLGDLGGVTEVIMLIFGFFLYPVSEHSFMLQAIKKLYLARTGDSGLFLEKSTSLSKKLERKNSVARSQSFKLQKELQKHRVARVRVWDSI
jgi:hypothetical protein